MMPEDKNLMRSFPPTDWPLPSIGKPAGFISEVRIIKGAGDHQVAVMDDSEIVEAVKAAMVAAMKQSDGGSFIQDRWREDDESGPVRTLIDGDFDLAEISRAAIAAHEAALAKAGFVIVHVDNADPVVLRKVADARQKRYGMLAAAPKRGAG